jgi:hypothetical protein
MRRREFLVPLGGAAVLAPSDARAQQAGRTYRVRVFVTVNNPAMNAAYHTFIAGMRAQGFVEGLNLVLMQRTWRPPKPVEGRVRHWRMTDQRIMRPALVQSTDFSATFICARTSTRDVSDTSWRAALPALTMATQAISATVTILTWVRRSAVVSL